MFWPCTIYENKRCRVLTQWWNTLCSQITISLCSMMSSPQKTEVALGLVLVTNSTAVNFSSYFAAGLLCFSLIRRLKINHCNLGSITCCDILTVDNMLTDLSNRLIFYIMLCSMFDLFVIVTDHKIVIGNLWGGVKCKA